ncbi:MBL fold metallo-hydrolase [Nocardia implantans]|uniref:MBL fold metallo-hydrolase n=1 Tax=Nocardia implantans TaxID=3108168 RepID=A0ABU6B2I0_9NOCA|nr:MULTISPECIES: MBL fold metallo-hydrolase [unclassified Nocardia]MBF6195850.1 MBL fold metallo-hydrolase [Nocardia beijingensis]MEA3531730.1 MBL fold metallo-hydrolase [Nocardia sp. CDC192]MEB3513895.1 MBL fold metallo-hydrolase [Nocardia sp. CDC186]
MCNLPGLGLLTSLRAGRLRPATGPADPRTIAARARFFGADTVDPRTGALRTDRVVLSWVGCSTYALAMGGSVLLLDAWVPRLTSTGYVPATPQDLVDLAPAAIFIGHGHFDHAADAGRIARAGGAVVHGTAEHCATVAAQVGDPAFPTATHGDADTAIGTREDCTVGTVQVSVVRHLHSARTPPDPVEGSPRFFPRPEPGIVLSHPPTPRGLLDGLPRLRDPEGGVLLYQFRVPGFSLVWHDSSGPLTERAPQVFDTLAALPATDVQIGAVQGYNQISNGLRDPRTYIQALRPGLFVPSHHDNWLPGLTASAATYDAPLRAELERIPAPRRPQLRVMHDPADYVHPQRLTFRL